MDLLTQWQSGHELYRAGLIGISIFGLSACLMLLFISAPYGRHHRAGWGPSVRARTGWVVMEAPSFIGFMACSLILGLSGVGAWIGVLFAAHYLYRAFVFPFRMRGGDKPKPWLTVGLAFVFNSVNGAVNAYDLQRAESFSLSAVVFGVVLFALGVFINHQSDAILLRLRQPGETGYSIPYGGLYRWVSAPNYLGEIIQWTGFAIAAATPAAWVFALFTVANLAPRARSHHQWYLDRFSDYPRDRKRLVPGLW